MGMPETVFNFKEQKNTFTYRLGRGSVAYVHIADGASTAEFYTISNKLKVEEVLTSATDSEELKQVANKMFKYGAAKVLVAVASKFEDVKTWLEGQRFNYLAMNKVTSDVITWAESINFLAGRRFILFSDGSACKASNEKYSGHVVSVYPESENAVVGTPADIASIVAGCNDRSATFCVLGYNEEFTNEELNKYPSARSEMADTKINEGLLTVVNDGEKLKIGRAVTTHYKYSAEEPSNDTSKSALSKVRCVDVLDLVEDDIRDTFENQYVGQVLNGYDDKMAFISHVNGTYLAGLEGTALNKESRNYVDIDLKKHIEIATAAGMKVDDMSEMELRKIDTGDKLYLIGNLRPLDAMEDLTINFSVGN